jgi:hypothetical protein
MSEIILNDPQLKREKISEFTKGQLPDGSIIGRYRNADYASDKYNINPLANGNVDLMLTRAFVNNMFVEQVRPKAFLFNSTDYKTDKLIGKYSIDIMGINQEYWEKRQVDIYLPVLKFQIKRKANL